MMSNCRDNIGNFVNIQGKHRKFPDSKDQGYCDFCYEISQLNVSAKSVLHMKHLQVIEIGTGKICDRTGKIKGI